MAKEIAGKLDASGKKVAIAVSRFNEFITSKLVEGAIDCLVRHGAKDSDITIVRVPGAFEIPSTVKRLAKGSKFDAVIALGCVIKGDTPHFDYVAAEVSKGVAQVGMESSVPVIFGVLTTDSIEQAVERAGTKAGNKGWDAAMTAIEMIGVFNAI